MNKIWVFLIVSSITLLLFNSPESVLSGMLSASQKALSFSLTLCYVYAVWLGILKIAEDCGINKKIAKLFNKLIKKLFDNPDSETTGYIALNLSANILGMGNACTPMGIKAMQGLNKNKTTVASRAMIMLIVINCTSIQLIPTTVIGMRAALGSVSPSDIILPSIVATTLSTLTGILLVLLLSKIKYKKRSKV